jgi:hypothetical protein
LEQGGILIVVVIGLVTLHVFYFSNYSVEKQDEEMQKAKTLLAERQQYTVGNPWIM